ncbi:MAG: hypothetical protein H7247_11280 [Polaromonas sp.]|nr:hypothetical protein [Gemmatimonadaceae bacterium]
MKSRRRITLLLAFLAQLGGHTLHAQQASEGGPPSAFNFRNAAASSTFRITHARQGRPTWVGIDAERVDTTSHFSTWHAIRVGALIGGGVGLVGGVIADARQSGPTKIYGIAPTGGLIVGALGGAVIGAIVAKVHVH